MVRFQAANGAVSMVGNLGLMRVLVSGAGMPVVMANAVAIICCSAVNFGLGEWWAFAGARGIEAGGLEARSGLGAWPPG
jgi:putative flippase GtrA